MTTDRTCPECGITFTVRNGRQQFCTPAHKAAFHALMQRRGQVLLPFAFTHRRGGRYKDSSPELAAYARQQMCALLDQWVTEDRAAGRACEGIVATKQAMAWRAADVL